VYTETLKMPLMHKQPKKWWTNKQTDKPNTLPLLRMHARGNNAYSGLRFRSKTVYSVIIFILTYLYCRYAKYSV